MLDTSEEDARTQENFKMTDALHQEALERGDKDAIELQRLSEQAKQEVFRTKRKTRKTGQR